MRRTELRRTASLSRSRLQPRSPHMTVRLRIYRKAADLFLAEHPRCEFPGGCPSTDVSVHHLGGRVGPRLMDESLWRAACDLHNQRAESEPAWSDAHGWRVSRVGRAA